jgi:hypothetical protein
MVTGNIFFEVWTECLNTTETSFGFKGLNTVHTCTDICSYFFKEICTREKNHIFKTSSIVFLHFILPTPMQYEPRDSHKLSSNIMLCPLFFKDAFH